MAALALSRHRAPFARLFPLGHFLCNNRRRPKRLEIVAMSPRSEAALHEARGKASEILELSEADLVHLIDRQRGERRLTPLIQLLAMENLSEEDRALGLKALRCIGLEHGG
jgi:hypothetical protein